jgi:hypothetical protein
MARINIGARQAQLPQRANLPRPNITALIRGELATGAAFQQLGASVANFANKIVFAEGNAVASNRIAQAQQEFNDFFIERSTVADQFATLETDVNERLSSVRQRALDDVTNARAQTLIEQRLNILETSARGNAANTARRQQIDFAVDQTNNALNLNAVNAANATREIDRDIIIKDSLALIDGQVDAGLMSRVTADAAREKFLGSVVEQSFERMINDDPQRALQLLDNTKPIDNLDPGTRNRLRRSARAEVNTLKAAQLKIARGIVDDVVFALEHGFMPPNFEAAKRLAATDPSLAQDLRLSTGQYLVITERAAQEPFGRAVWIDRQRARKTLSKGEIQTLEAVERIHTQQASLAGKDPLRLGVQKALIREQGALDFANPETLALQLSERRAAASVVSAHLGEPVSPLFQSDTDALLRVLDTGGVDIQVNALGAIALGLGDDVGGFLHQLDKMGEVTYAQIANLLVDRNATAAMQLALGKKIVAKDKAAAPKESEFRDEAIAYMGDSFADRPIDQAGIIKNARLLYTARAADPTSVETGAMREAIDTLVGGFIDYPEQFPLRDPRIDPGEGQDAAFRSAFFGAQRIAAPVPGVGTKDFLSWIRNMTDADVKKGGGVAGFEDNPDQVLRWIRRQEGDAQLVNLGRGLYGVEILGVTDEMELLISADDPRMPFILDWEAR